MDMPSPKVIVSDIFKEAKLRAQWLASAGHLVKEDTTKRIGIKKMSILFELEYWKVLELLKLWKFPHELKFHSTWKAIQFCSCNCLHNIIAMIVQCQVSKMRI